MYNNIEKKIKKKKSQMPIYGGCCAIKLIFYDTYSFYSNISSENIKPWIRNVPVVNDAQTNGKIDVSFSSFVSVPFSSRFSNFSRFTSVTTQQKISKFMVCSVW